MATLSTVISYGEPTGTIVTEIGTPGPTGQTGPQGPAGPTFTGGPITSPITFDAGTNSTVFENGDVFAQDNTSGSYGAIYTGGLQASNGTLTLDITGAGITFGDSTFQSTAFPGSAAFYPSTGNPSGFLTAASLSGYATESWVTSRGYATQSYVNSRGFITASALAPYLLSSTAASTYQTLAGMSGYLSKAGNLSGLSNTATARTNLGLGTMATETASNYLTVSAAASGYYPLSGNPSNFLTDAPSDGSQYARQDGAWSVVTGGGGGSYLPLAGGTMTGPIVFDGTSGQYISKGNFDTSRGGNYGISLVCSIGYEFNWQAGWLTTTEQSSVTPRPLYLDSLAGTTLRVWDSSTSLGTEVSHTGITFPDATVQTTAANPFNGGTITENIVIDQLLTSGFKASYQGNGIYFDDPNGYKVSSEEGLIMPQLTANDGSSQTVIYGTGITFPDSTTQSSAAFVPGSGDLNLQGYSITDGNFSSPAGQVSAQNVTMSSGGVLTFGDSTVQTTAYTGGGGGVPEAPNDGFMYGRVLECWARIPSTPTFMQFATNVTSIASWSTSAGQFALSANGNVIVGPYTQSSDAMYIAYGDTASTVFDFSNFGNVNFSTVQIYFLNNITSGPDFNTSGGNNSIGDLTLSYCSAMVNPPNLASGWVNCSYVYLQNNTSMTSAPSLPSVYLNIFLTNCAIANCYSILDQLYDRGGAPGYLDISGGTNQAIDPSYGNLINLQDGGWTVVYNSL